jgi:hypothetical protein
MSPRLLKGLVFYLTIGGLSRLAVYVMSRLLVYVGRLCNIVLRHRDLCLEASMFVPPREQGSNLALQAVVFRLLEVFVMTHWQLMGGVYARYRLIKTMWSQRSSWVIEYCHLQQRPWGTCVLLYVSWISFSSITGFFLVSIFVQFWSYRWSMAH